MSWRNKFTCWILRHKIKISTISSLIVMPEAPLASSNGYTVTSNQIYPKFCNYMFLSKYPCSLPWWRFVDSDWDNNELLDLEEEIMKLCLVRYPNITIQGCLYSLQWQHHFPETYLWWHSSQQKNFQKGQRADNYVIPLKNESIKPLLYLKQNNQ